MKPDRAMIRSHLPSLGLLLVRLPVDVLDLPRPVIRNGRFHAAVHGPQGEPQLLVGRVVR